MIERKLKAYGLKKVIPDDDLLGEAYRAFHRSKELREEFEELESEFEESKIKVPKNLKNQVRAILEKHPDLRWDDAVQIVLDETQLDHVRERSKRPKRNPVTLPMLTTMARPTSDEEATGLPPPQQDRRDIRTAPD